MHNFKVGDFLVGKASASDEYRYTTEGVIVKVIGDHGDVIEVECLINNSYTPRYSVDASHFTFADNKDLIKSKFKPW